MIKKIIKNYFQESIDKIKPKINGVPRFFSQIDKRIAIKYLANSNIKKLHIGCGPHIIHGWLNSDYGLKSKEILNFDATKVFPFDNDTFDYIFSEHMVEHVSYEKGIMMFLECFRVLKPNGKIRIATPGLEFLVDLYVSSNKSKIQEAFIKDQIDEWTNAPLYDSVFVVNNYVRNWGHEFIYDTKILIHALESCGFSNVKACNISESSDQVFEKLENVGRKQDGMIELESIVVEGIKL